jgi:hypothetical protein
MRAEIACPVAGLGYDPNPNYGRPDFLATSPRTSRGRGLAGKAKDNAAARDFASELQKMRPAFSEVGEPTIRLNSDKTEYKNDFDIRITLADLAPKKKEKTVPPPKKKL